MRLITEKELLAKINHIRKEIQYYEATQPDNKEAIAELYKILDNLYNYGVENIRR